MEITDKGKEIYNAYLRALGEKQNRPYRKREKFENLKEDVLKNIFKMETFFGRFPHIQPYIFFKSAFQVLNTDFIPLEFFATHKAVVCYSRFTKAQYSLSVESDEIVNSFIDGLEFLLTFCQNTQIPLSYYRHSVNDHGVLNLLVHLKEQHISMYHLHLLEVSLDDLPKDCRDMYVRDFDELFEKTRMKYYSAVRLLEIQKKLKNSGLYA